VLRLILIGAAALLLAVAAASIYMALQRADVLAWLATAAVSAVASAVLPSLAKRMSPEKEAKWRKRYLRSEGDRDH
jgi:hypothetical protein